MTVFDWVPGRLASMAVKMMCAHRHRHVGQHAEGREIDVGQFADRGIDDRKVLVAVGHGPAVAGDMLDDGQHAAGDQALGGGPAERRDFLDGLAVGAVADDVVGALLRHVEDWHAIDVDAEVQQVMGDQPGAKPGDFPADQRIVGRQRAVGAAGRILGPVRRAEPLHPAALLIDEDRRMPADRLAQGRGQGPDLRRALDVALEQDEAPGPGVAEKGDLVLRQGRSGAAQDTGAVGHRTKQLFPAAFSLSQKAWAEARSPNPVTEVR